MDVTDFALTNVRKNCYTFIQNGNEVLPRFLIETAKRLMTSVHGTGVSAFFCYRNYQLLVRRFNFDYAGNESDSRSVFYLIQGRNKSEEHGGKRKRNETEENRNIRRKTGTMDSARKIRDSCCISRYLRGNRRYDFWKRVAGNFGFSWAILSLSAPDPSGGWSGNCLDVSAFQQSEPEGDDTGIRSGTEKTGRNTAGTRSAGDDRNVDHASFRRQCRTGRGSGADRCDALA